MVNVEFQEIGLVFLYNIKCHLEGNVPVFWSTNNYKMHNKDN